MSEPRDEAEIIRQVVRGEKDEFRHLVIAHQDKVYAMIMRQVADPAIARELSQETFMRAYSALESFRFQASFSTWVIRIALNLTNNYFTSKRYKQKQRTVSLSREDIQVAANNLEADSYDFESVEEIRRIVSQLKPKLREVLVLCGFEHKSYEEAAAILEVPIGTVRSRLNKARQVVRKEFFGNENNE